MEWISRIIQKIKYLLTDKAFWINLLILIVVFFITGWIVMLLLKQITRWGQSADVPKVVGLHIDKARDLINDADLEWEIKDSVYKPDLKEGTVLDVMPPAGENIKLGRTVFLVVSTKRPPMVEMPQLTGRSSLRFAIVELESRGLKVGSLTYIPSPEKDAVLGQKIGNTDIEAGTLIPKGTTINLVLGEGLSDVIVEVPYLLGKTKSQVELILKANNIFYQFYFDKSVKDSSNAVVVKQYPMSNGIEKLNLGEPMDVFFSKELPENILNDSTFKARNSK